MSYRDDLIREINENDPKTMTFMRQLTREFGCRMHTFRWLVEPAVLRCTYHRSINEEKS